MSIRKSNYCKSGIRRSRSKTRDPNIPHSAFRDPQFEDPKSAARHGTVRNLKFPIRSRASNIPHSAFRIPHSSKFAADVMLGRLARWLRASGLDVYYDNAASDDQLVQLYLNEKRWIITRDRGLVKRRVLHCVIFIESETLEEQLREFFEKTKFIVEPNRLRPFSRCVDCNHELQLYPPEKAKLRVPPYVFQHHEIFKICPFCDKVYWAGTHRERIQAFLKKACPF